MGGMKSRITVDLWFFWRRGKEKVCTCVCKSLSVECSTLSKGKNPNIFLHDKKFGEKNLSQNNTSFQRTFCTGKKPIRSERKRIPLNKKNTKPLPKIYMEKEGKREELEISSPINCSRVFFWVCFFFGTCMEKKSIIKTEVKQKNFLCKGESPHFSLSRSSPTLLKQIIPTKRDNKKKDYYTKRGIFNCAQS